MTSSIAILGGGNLGLAIARGLARSGYQGADHIVVTRRHRESLEAIAAEGFRTETDNVAAIRDAELVLLCVQPSQVSDLVKSLRSALDPGKHILVSVATGVRSSAIREAAGADVPVVRAMPNTAIGIGESMTCVAAPGPAGGHLSRVTSLFDSLGTTLVIDEDQMTEATALCACGIAFFLRAIRAASQGGIEIGFHAEDAIAMAAQTARGAASLLLSNDTHPEREIDRVTTPMGCTIAGLNQMEHQGFSSALIKGIVTSSRKAATLGSSAQDSAGSDEA